MMDFAIIAFLLLLIILISVMLLYFFREEKKKLILPGGIWLSVLFLAVFFSLLSLFDLPTRLAHISLYILLVSWFAGAIFFIFLIFIVPALLIYDLIKRHSDYTTYLGWGSLWLLLTLVLALFSYDKLRMEKFRRFGESMEPFIEKIESYGRRSGAYPRMLETAVPGCLNNLCNTHMLAYPSLEYTPMKSSSRPGYDSFKLTLNCYVGIISPVLRYLSADSASRSNLSMMGEWRYILLMDRLEYRPGQDYEKSTKTRRVIKLGKWAYIRQFR